MPPLTAKDLTDIDDNSLGCLAIQILNRLPVQVYVKDIGLRYLFCNSAARQLLGKDQEYSGKTADEMLKDDNAKRLIEQTESRVLRTGKSNEMHEQVYDSADRFRTLSIRRYPILNLRKQSIGLVSLALDSSYEQQRQITETIVTLIAHDWISVFIEGLHDKLAEVLYYKAHKARKPSEDAARLLAITGEGDLDQMEACSGRLGGALKEWVNDIYLPVHFMDGYLKHLKWYLGALNDPKHVETQTSTFRIRLAVFDYISRFCANSKRNFMPIRYESVEQNLTVHADVNLLRMMTLEMVRNHHNWGHDNTSLIVRARKIGKMFCVEFESPGERISDRTLANMFRLGWTKPGTRKGGLGFGLFFMKQIVAIQNGELRVDRKPGSNTFVFTLGGS